MFRDYSSAPAHVEEFYNKQHSTLTYDRARANNQKFINSPMRYYSLAELFDICNDIIDPSDPDTSLPQTEHAYQTAKAALDMGLPEDYAALGLVHDLGKCVSKLLGIEMTYVVGDTYPLGCAFEYRTIPFGQSLLENPDYDNCLCLYEAKCGFNNMMFTGHDEFIYLSLMNSKHLLPPYAVYVARFHSFHAWHEHMAYKDYASQEDYDMIPYINEFSRCDLYHKHSEPVDQETREQIDMIANKYFPFGLKFPDETFACFDAWRGLCFQATDSSE